MGKAVKKPSFSESLKRLEEIVEHLERQDLELEEGLRLLEEGVNLHKFCKNELISANKKITLLLKDSGQDNLEDSKEEDLT